MDNLIIIIITFSVNNYLLNRDIPGYPSEQLRLAL